MSIFRKRELTCPVCATTAFAEVALSLHGPRVPLVMAQIAAGEFQRIECAGCGNAFFADGPLIYTDFDRKQWVAVFPLPWRRSWVALEQQPFEAFRSAMIDSAPAFLRAETSGFRIRTTFGLDRLAEKFRLWSAGHDDAVVELAKFRLMLAEGRLHPGAIPIAEDVDADSVLLIWSDGAGGRAEARMSTAQLAGCAEDPAWSGPLTALRRGSFVDVARFFVDGRQGEIETLASTAGSLYP